MDRIGAEEFDEQISETKKRKKGKKKSKSKTEDSNSASGSYGSGSVCSDASIEKPNLVSNFDRMESVERVMDSLTNLKLEFTMDNENTGYDLADDNTNHRDDLAKDVVDDGFEPSVCNVNENRPTENYANLKSQEIIVDAMANTKLCDEDESTEPSKGPIDMDEVQQTLEEKENLLIKILHLDEHLADTSSPLVEDNSDQSKPQTNNEVEASLSLSSRNSIVSAARYPASIRTDSLESGSLMQFGPSSEMQYGPPSDSSAATCSLVSSDRTD
jgi:hypothetical protein